VVLDESAQININSFYCMNFQLLIMSSAADQQVYVLILMRIFLPFHFERLHQAGAGSDSFVEWFARFSQCFQVFEVQLREDSYDYFARQIENCHLRAVKKIRRGKIISENKKN
jgi:hypothetical protein